MITVTDERGATISFESARGVRWYGRKASSPFRGPGGPAYAVVMKEWGIWLLRGREAELFLEWADQMTVLPSHCCHCGVYLQGGLTDHQPGCAILQLIREVCREAHA
jgi:hypothetical protein